MRLITIIIIGIIILTLGIITYLYNYNMVMGKVIINGTVIVDGTTFSGPLINNEQFDNCLRGYDLNAITWELLYNHTIEELCVYEQLGPQNNPQSMDINQLELDNFYNRNIILTQP